jgi:hypothetical protein
MIQFDAHPVRHIDMSLVKWFRGLVVLADRVADRL